MIDVFHRHQIELIGRRYSDVSAPTSSANVVELAVGFADIAGYTGLSHRLDPSELAAMLARFEATTGDVIAAAGANVAKRIGDAVMFVTNAPGVACALALELIEACTRERLPKLRVGLAVGEVIVRQGDFYGPTVNLAARLVASAEPGTALADAALHGRLVARARRLRLRARRHASSSPASTSPSRCSNSSADSPTRTGVTQRRYSAVCSRRFGWLQLEGADLPGAELDRALERRDGPAVEVDDPARGRARRRARSSTGPGSGSVRKTRTTRPPGERSTAETSAPSTRSAAPLAGRRVGPRRRSRAPVRTGRANASAAP